jgi:hypothetical protein
MIGARWGSLALLACLGTPACESQGLEIDVGVARMYLSGDVALGPSGGGVDLNAIENDIDDSLDLGGQSKSPYIGVISANVSTLWFGEDGNGVLQNDYGGLPRGTPVATSADMIVVKAAVDFEVIHNSSRAGSFVVAPGVGLEFIDYDLAATAGSRNAIDDYLLTPMIYLRTEAQVSAFTGTLILGGFSADLLSVDSTLVDLDAMLRWSPVPLFQIFAGYRGILFDAEGESGSRPYSADLALQGWLFGIELPF